MPTPTHDDNPLRIAGRGHRIWRRIGIGLLIAFCVLSLIVEVVLHRAEPILKGRIIETLSARFDSKVELDTLDVSILKGLQVSGEGLRIYPPDDVVVAGATHPLIAVKRFDFHAAILGLFIKPMHVESVHVVGLDIHIPPKQYRQAAPKAKKKKMKIKIVVAAIVCEDSRLVIGTAKPGKDPKVFILKSIVMHSVGADKPWPYDATLTNAIPPGAIHAVGTFGPWNVESPGDSAVTGKYTFDNANLGAIKGIEGILNSTGEFNGQLDHINVEGDTQTPDFALDTGNHPMPLATHFRAVVDGTSGDTYLQPVEATLGTSHFTCSGAVVNIKGKGHLIQLDIDIPAGQIADFLNLAVKTRPPIMTGLLQMKAKLNIPPGKQSVTQKIGIQGGFHLTRVNFSNPQVEDKVDMLSLRARGKPDEAHAGAPDVHSRILGDFILQSGDLHFSRLSYTLPGASVNLAGEYTLDGKKFDFAGKVRTNAKLSQMVSTWWKSLLLKPVDPFFSKHGAGAEIPVKITGTQSAPKFGLDIGGK